MADEKIKDDIDETIGEAMEEMAEETKEDTIDEVAEEEIFEEEEELEEDILDKEELEEEASEEIIVEDGEQKELKKGFFGKKKDKKDKKDIQIEDLTDRLKRQMAEFDNFRKRTEKEKATMYEVGAKSVIEKMLSVVDNFERGLGAVPEEQKADPFVDGMEKIYKQLVGTLEELEVKAIEAVGQEFDPSYHNAVMHIEDEELGDNIVAEEFQKGYTYRDGVVRHSMVKVAN